MAAFYDIELPLRNNNMSFRVFIKKIIAMPDIHIAGEINNKIEIQIIRPSSWVLPKRTNQAFLSSQIAHGEQHCKTAAWLGRP